MEYWKGYMNWPLEKDWKCEICEGGTLIWGLPHGLCRCATCHTQYRMRDDSDKVVMRPICQLKPEYYKSVQLGWKELRKPIDEFTKEEWNNLLKPELVK